MASSKVVKDGLSAAPKPAKAKKKRSELPMLPPCEVCGGKATGFHYGANTCEACKVSCPQNWKLLLVFPHRTNSESKNLAFFRPGGRKQRGHCWSHCYRCDCSFFWEKSLSVSGVSLYSVWKISCEQEFLQKRGQLLPCKSFRQEFLGKKSLAEFLVNHWTHTFPSLSRGKTAHSLYSVHFRVHFCTGLLQKNDRASVASENMRWSMQTHARRGLPLHLLSVREMHAGGNGSVW